MPLGAPVSHSNFFERRQSEVREIETHVLGSAWSVQQVICTILEPSRLLLPCFLAYQPKATLFSAFCRIFFGALGRTRTCDFLIRSQLMWVIIGTHRPPYAPVESRFPLSHSSVQPHGTS